MVWKESIYPKINQKVSKQYIKHEAIIAEII